MRGWQFVLLWTLAGALWLSYFAMDGDAAIASEDNARVAWIGAAFALSMIVSIVFHWMILRRDWGRPNLAVWFSCTCFLGLIGTLVLYAGLLLPDILESNGARLEEKYHWLETPNAWWFMALQWIVSGLGYAAAFLWISRRTSVMFLFGTIVVACSSEALIAAFELQRETGIPGQRDFVAIAVNALQTIWWGILTGTCIWIGSAPIRLQHK